MQTKDETARFVADAHFQMDHGIQRIFRISEPEEASESKPVKLLEVNPATTETGIMPIGLGADPSRGVNYAITVVEVSPDEFNRLITGELTLPHGWTLSGELHPTREALEMRQ